jgi:jumonji domain-containing protein 7
LNRVLFLSLYLSSFPHISVGLWFDDDFEVQLEVEAQVDFSTTTTMEAAIITAINTYHELNPSFVDELHEEPSPLEFMRHVARNRPFVVRSAATDWTAFKAWDAKYLRKALEGESVNVSITPCG